METNHEPEVSDNEWASPGGWQALDDTIVVVGLLLFQASLFKSGYPAEIQVELMDRVNKLVRLWSRKGV